MIKHKLTNQNLDLKESICKRITNPFYLIAVALTALGAYGFILPTLRRQSTGFHMTDITAVCFSVRGRFTATVVEKSAQFMGLPRLV